MMKHLLSLFLILLVVNGFSQDSSAIQLTNLPQENYKFIYKRGEEKYQKLDYRGAISDFQLVLKLKPNHSKSKSMLQVVKNDLHNYFSNNDIPEIINGYDYEYFKRGLYNRNKNNFSEAIADYTKALITDSNYIDAYNGRGVVYSCINEYDKAIIEFSKAILIDSTAIEPCFNRALAKKKLGLFDSALIDYGRVLILNPNFSAAYVGIGVIYSEKKTYREALTNFEKAIQLNPEDGISYHNKGNVMSYLGDFEGAIDAYNKAIEYRPYSIAYIYADRGFTLIKLKNYAAAIEDFDKALLLNTTLIRAYFYRGKAKQLRGNLSEGCEDIKKAKELGFEIPNDEIIILCE